MGKISNIKAISNEKFQVTLELTQSEVEWLKGSMTKMHLFSESNLEDQTRLVQRGKRDSTKYFLVPKIFRKGALPSNSVPCTRIETRTKFLYIFSVNKYGLKDEE